jgi:alpha-mannosidase
LPHEREELAEVSVWDWSGDASRMAWTGADGSSLLHQVMSSGFDGYWGHLHAEVLVKVRVPAMGYATIVLDEAAPATIGVQINDPRVAKPESAVLENEFVRAELDVRDGGVISYVDKLTGTDYVKPGCPMGVFRLVEEDTIRGMSAWTVGRYRNVHALNRGVRFTGARLDPGLLRQSAAYEADFCNGSRLAVTVSLDCGERMLRFDVTVRWQEIGTQDTFFPQLNFLMPVSYGYSSIRYDVPMGAIDRGPMDMDVPAQSYGMPVNGAGDSLMLVSDSKYGYRGTAEGLSLTLIRSSADPDPWPEVGQHRISIAIAPCGGGRLEEAALARAFCRGLLVAAARAHKGALPHTLSLMELSGGVVLSAVKMAEDGRGIVVRYYEAEGRGGEGAIRFFKAPEAAHAVNVLEQPVEGNVRVDGCTVRFGYRAFGAGSLRVMF